MTVWCAVSPSFGLPPQVKSVDSCAKQEHAIGVATELSPPSASSLAAKFMLLAVLCACKRLIPQHSVHVFVCMPVWLLFIFFFLHWCRTNTKSRESAHTAAIRQYGFAQRVSAQRLAWQDRRREIITVLRPTASNSPIVTHYGVVNSILAVVTAEAGALGSCSVDSMHKPHLSPPAHGPWPMGVFLMRAREKRDAVSKRRRATVLC